MALPWPCRQRLTRHGRGQAHKLYLYITGTRDNPGNPAARRIDFSVDQLGKIRSLLESSPARQVEPGFDVWELDPGPWWKLFTGWKAIDRVKEGLLAAAWEMPEPLFFVPPTMEMASELKPFLVPRDAGVWLVNRERSPKDFYGAELNQGNWIVYAADNPARTSMPNTFKTRPQVLVQFMSQQGMKLMIDAFYDDREWRVALHQA
jgi:hypothetical protein